MKQNIRIAVSMALALTVSMGGAGYAAPVTGPWVRTSGNDNIEAASSLTNSPVLVGNNSANDQSQNSVQSAFPNIALANVGDYAELRGTFDLVRTMNLTDPNRLNDQMRIGLFTAPAPPETGQTNAPRGFIAEFGTGLSLATPPSESQLRQLTGNQQNPFSNSASTPEIGLAGDDPEDDHITGEHVVLIAVLRITRQAGDTVDITGNFNGITESTTDNDYLQSFSLLGHTPDASFDFTVNRAAFFFGNTDVVGEGAASGLLNVEILTNVTSPVIPPDYNGNGTVDAADYVVWRKNDGLQPGYDLWRSVFGNAPASGGGFVDLSPVPEPASAILLFVAAAAIASQRRMRCR